MRAAPNKPAALRWMGVTLYGEEAVPADNYGMIGRALRRYDLEYLASLLWQNAARPPNGDPFKYVLGVAKGKSTAQSRKGQPDALEESRRRRAETTEYTGTRGPVFSEDRKTTIEGEYSLGGQL